MANAVFVHKPNSIYDDAPASHYHFPKIYLSRVKQTIGDLIVYYGPLHDKPGRYYWASARVVGIRSDPMRHDHYYADVDQFLDFDEPVEYRSNGGFERKLVALDGSVNGGTAQAAVRIISAFEMTTILDAGHGAPQMWPDRIDAPELEQEAWQLDGFHDSAIPELAARPIIQCLSQRRFRDQKFKQNVRRAYDRTCALTGLRLINGHGRPEVEAAHIIPVEHDGPDSVQNGIALSGTVHWMFDRGLLSIGDDYSILRSRHLNHDVSHLLRPEMIAMVPADPHLRPHPHYLGWHRENVFKG